MPLSEIFAKIIKRQTIGLMFHQQMANYFDFLNLHGYKRWQEYRYLDETLDIRKTNRYFINHFNILIPTMDIQDPNALPESWQGKDRREIESKYPLVVSAFKKWYDWEYETKLFLADAYIALQQQKEVATACFVSDLIKSNDCELKVLSRELIALKDGTMDFILQRQENIHDEYKDKTVKVGEALRM